MDVALREEIEEGNAQIICQFEDGKKEKYNIKIEKKYTNNTRDNKSMLIKITDEIPYIKQSGPKYNPLAPIVLLIITYTIVSVISPNKLKIIKYHKFI